MPPEITVNDVYQTFTVFPNNQYRIRPMHDTDIAIVVNLEQATWGNASWSLEEFFQALTHPYWNCWILESTTTNGLLLGYGLQYFSDGLSHIANLCIHPDQRGRGLGGILLRHMINYASQIEASGIQLEVDTSNKSAYMLYVKHGFRIVQYLSKYYSEYSDAYLMKLLL